MSRRPDELPEAWERLGEGFALLLRDLVGESGSASPEQRAEIRKSLSELLDIDAAALEDEEEMTRSLGQLAERLRTDLNDLLTNSTEARERALRSLSEIEGALFGAYAEGTDSAADAIRDALEAGQVTSPERLSALLSELAELFEEDSASAGDRIDEIIGELEQSLGRLLPPMGESKQERARRLRREAKASIDARLDGLSFRVSKRR